ncbi:hypothetical protein ASPZODRAFT_70893 [Penicilliopsis zonata CBS 506.65]|uniref:ATP-dependent DNA helicase n=1 Tax=Penicilliopsis zonata CBS 506.65 TaxID=1073090 RepID=A0A1L9SC84_9EURO|nr:hypothetical protein ASPZODRAFT_70893 [Penicilliopsis zonata CBS 506.65]OJJ44707.1 hypothetical protein ASPZODRAFT_70893 [Penicilliopsis zonata CBS 506.65]
MLRREAQHPKVDIDFTLRRVFGKQSFRPLQREVISAAIDGHDVFLQASTSFGKSLCFQLPAVVSNGVTLVISPLLALMTDQVSALEAIGVAVATINSTTGLPERRKIMDDLFSGHPKTRLLYVTPELCQTEAFRRNLQIIHSQGQLIRVAIDEAHCISEWGHDFRPAYKELSWFRLMLKNPPVPMSALTATATPRVRADIIKLLGFDTGTLKIFNTPSARPNIHYEVRYLTDFASDPTMPEDFQVDDLLSWLKAIQDRRIARLGSDAVSRLPPMSGIIYVPLRVVCDQLAGALSSSGRGIQAVAYHAGLSTTDRNRIQAMWTSTKPPPTPVDRGGGEGETVPTAFSIIVATNAFGMGIDNPHVRFVVHWSPPRSFEGLVQESGRAGRDGCAAVSLVYYNTQERDRVLDRLGRDAENSNNRPGGIMNNSNSRNREDAARLKKQNHKARLESFQKVIRYCETTIRCRHEMIKEYFGDLELEMMGSQAAPVPQPSTTLRTSPCDFACDFCKEGRQALSTRKRKMVAESAVEDWMELSMVPIMRAMFPAQFRGAGSMYGPQCQECDY